MLTHMGVLHNCGATKSHDSFLITLRHTHVPAPNMLKHCLWQAKKWHEMLETIRGQDIHGHQWTCSPDFFVCRFKREHLSWYFLETSFHWVWLSLWWYFARIEWQQNMELYPASPREKKIGTAPMAHRKKKGATVPPKKTQLSHFKDGFRNKKVTSCHRERLF